MSNRPTGITLLAIVFFILGGLSLLWSLLVFGLGSASWITGTIFDATGMQSFGSTSTWQGFLGLVSATVQILVGIGLLGLKRWAWILAFFGVAITVVQGIIGIFGGGFFAFCCGILGLLIPAGILFYLLRPDVRKAFGQ